MCIRPDQFKNDRRGNEGTPEDQKKFRRLSTFIPGKIQTHHGLLGLKQNVPRHHSYGRPVYSSHHVNVVIKS